MMNIGNATRRIRAFVLLTCCGWCCAAAALGLSACGKDSSSGAGGGSNASGSGLPDTSKIKSGVESAANSARETAAKAAETIRQEIAGQLDGQEGKIDELKTKASKFTDQKLKELLDALDAKVDQARAKLDELKTKAGASGGGDTAALKAELTQMMGDLKNLYDQAIQRLAEVSKGGGQ